MVGRVIRGLEESGFKAEKERPESKTMAGGSLGISESGGTSHTPTPDPCLWGPTTSDLENRVKN